MADSILSTSTPGVHPMTVANPDGTNIGDALPTSGNNPSLTMSNTDTTVASTKVLTETIGAVSYVATLSYNAAGDFLSMTSWSQV